MIKDQKYAEEEGVGTDRRRWVLSALGTNISQLGELALSTAAEGKQEISRTI